MAKKTYEPSIISPQLVLSMATMMLVMTAIVIGTASKNETKQTIIKAAPMQPELLSSGDSIESLQSDLVILGTDTTAEDIPLLESVK